MPFILAHAFLQGLSWAVLRIASSLGSAGRVAKSGAHAALALAGPHVRAVVARVADRMSSLAAAAVPAGRAAAASAAAEARRLWAGPGLAFGRLVWRSGSTILGRLASVDRELKHRLVLLRDGTAGLEGIRQKAALLARRAVRVFDPNLHPTYAIPAKQHGASPEQQPHAEPLDGMPEAPVAQAPAEMDHAASARPTVRVRAEQAGDQGISNHRHPDEGTYVAEGAAVLAEELGGPAASSQAERPPGAATGRSLPAPADAPRASCTGDCNDSTADPNNEAAGSAAPTVGAPGEHDARVCRSPTEDPTAACLAPAVAPKAADAAGLMTEPYAPAELRLASPGAEADGVGIGGEFREAGIFASAAGSGAAESAFAPAESPSVVDIGASVSSVAGKPGLTVGSTELGTAEPGLPQHPSPPLSDMLADALAAQAQPMVSGGPEAAAATGEAAAVARRNAAGGAGTAVPDLAQLTAPVADANAALLPATSLAAALLAESRIAGMTLALTLIATAACTAALLAPLARGAPVGPGPELGSGSGLAPNATERASAVAGPAPSAAPCHMQGVPRAGPPSAEEPLKRPKATPRRAPAAVRSADQQYVTLDYSCGLVLNGCCFGCAE